MRIRLIYLVAAAAAIVTGCSHGSKFDGTWSASSISLAKPISKLTIESNVMHEVTLDGKDTVLEIKIVSDREAVASGALGGIDLTLIGPNTLHMNDPDNTFTRS